MKNVSERIRRFGPFLLLALTALIVIAMVYSTTVGIRLSSKYTPLVDAIMLVKFELTTSHLWFEEMLSGDREERMDYIYYFLSEAAFHARVMIEGGADDEWQYVPLDDEKLIEGISEMITLISELRYLTDKRYEYFKTSGAGSTLEMYYDSLYLDLIIKADKVEDDLRKRIKDQLNSFKLVQILMAALVVLSSIFVAILLVRNNREMQRKIHSLDMARTEQEVLLKEIHHRVKNNMTVISSLLSLQAEHIYDKRYLEMFEESQSRIRSMALVHEKLYQGEDFVRIDLRDYVESLADGIKSAFGWNIPVSQALEIEEIDLDIDTLVPFGLIMNELLTNVMKHAFEDIQHPEFRVEIKRQDARNVRLVVSDNGVGLPEDFDISKPSGLGLKLVNILVIQLKGTIESRSDKGATFSIVIPSKA